MEPLTGPIWMAALILFENRKACEATQWLDSFLPFHDYMNLSTRLITTYTWRLSRHMASELTPNEIHS